MRWSASQSRIVITWWFGMLCVSPFPNRPFELVANMPVLVFKQGDGDAVVTMSEGVPIFVGRAPECDIRVPDAEVSRRHAVFIIKNNLCGVKDLGSFNGTFLNGSPLTQPHQLLDGDTVTVATYNITYMLTPPQAKPKRRSTRLILPRAASDTAVQRFLKEVKTIGGQAKPSHSDTQPLAGAHHLSGAANVDTLADLSDPQVTARLLAAVGGNGGARNAPRRAARGEESVTSIFRMTPGPAEVAVEEPPEEVVVESLPAEAPDESARYPRREGTTAVCPTPPILADLDEMPISPKLRRAVEDRIREHDSRTEMTDEERTAGLAKLCSLAYAVMADEPLAVELTFGGVEHELLLGGAAYYLTLETLRDETAQRRSDAELRLSTVRNGCQSDAGASAIFRLVGKVTRRLAKPKASDEMTSKLECMLDDMTERSVWLAREMAFLERTLIREFWRVYADVAVRFVLRDCGMSAAVRAFLRYGAVGFNSWWMKEEVRRHIVASCETSLRLGAAPAADRTPILYADEYLAAVARQECAPSEDEAVKRLERNSPGWKADRALRKKTAAAAYLGLLEEKAADYLRRLDSGPDRRYTEETPSGTADQRERRNAIAAALKCLASDHIPLLREKLEEMNRRFRARELPAPSAVDLVRRECAALAEQSQRLAGPRNRFLPIVIREHFLLGADVVNDRESTAALVREYERLDPAIFVERLRPPGGKTNLVDIRLCPITVIVPAAGLAARVGLARDGMERGHLLVPACFSRQDIRRRQFAHMLADYRWEAARAFVGNRDLMSSETLAGAFMSLRWDWRGFAKDKRERGLVFSELSDRANWRRVYELYLSDAPQGARRLYTRNPDCYSRIIGKYIELPAGVAPLWKTTE